MNKIGPSFTGTFLNTYRDKITVAITPQNIEEY